MKWKQVNHSVLSATSSIVKIDRSDLSLLKLKALDSVDKRVRICAHQDSTDRLHEMLILISQESYVRPHKHQNKSESFHVIDGELDVVIFDNLGNITETIPMGDVYSGKFFFYRLSTSYFHTVVPRSDWVIFHETTNGPFLKEDTVYAPWAPHEQDLERVAHFLCDLKGKIETMSCAT